MGRKGRNRKQVFVTEAVRRNWDVDHLRDIISGNGFDITEPAETIIDRERIKNVYGADSPLFGTSYDDEQAFVERYKCRCGLFKGKEFEDEICPICNTKVESKPMDIQFTGWITLNNNRIINPYYFKVLESAIGKNNFNELIFIKHKVDKDGNVTLYQQDEKPLHPYINLGIDGFYDNFEEVLNYFGKKKKDKIPQIETLIREKHKVFTTCIPICSKFLRPQSRTKENFYYTTIDKEIATIFKLSEAVREYHNEYERQHIIDRIQRRVNTMWKIHFSTIDGKDGYVRKLVLGAELNYTSRNVIVPDPTLNENEVDISYNTMLELYKFRIIYYLMKMEDVTLTEAYNIWAHGFKFNQKIYNIMNYILEHEECHIVINRNPTINFYSLLLMKVRKIIIEDDVFVLAVPLSILPGLNADQNQGPIDIVIYL